MERTTLEKWAREWGCTVQRDRPMAPLTSFRIGGPAPLYVGAPDAETAVKFMGACREEENPLLLIGNGSNLLVSDEGLRGVVLRLPDTGEIERQGTMLRCGGGIAVKALCRLARQEGLAGLEFAFGIPGTVGGGVYMNAGAYGGQFADVVESALVARPDGTVCELSGAQMALSYRHSAMMDTGDIVLRADFRLKEGDPGEIGRQMDDYLSRRRDKQPLSYPSAGSFFKRPPGAFAGKLIEQCGLKGAAVGGAQVSEKHAGFLINRGGATCRDVVTLARQVRQTVFEQTGIRLEPEVRFVGIGFEEGATMEWNS